MRPSSEFNSMKYDFNKLEEKATDLFEQGLPSEAIKIYLFMADGDQSLDAGYLGKKIAECYEKMNDLYSAKYWYGRAVEENPEVRIDCLEARKRLEYVTINGLIDT
jgi:tetratricopeptide (TPR) repeat protein